MGRSPCCSSGEGLKKGAWTPSEDKILKDYITSHGQGKWRSIPKTAGLKRCGKSCRLRWLNYLRPDIKRGNITLDEEELIIRLHNLLGNRWSLIAGRLPGRTDNEIKNYWNTNIAKKAQAIESTNTESRAKKKPLSSTKEPKIQHSKPEGSSAVVRTKASRCSEVFKNSELQQHEQQLQQIGIMAQHETIEASISENPALVDDIDFLADLLENDIFMPPAQPQPQIHHENSTINEIDANDTSGLLYGSRHGNEAHNEFHDVEFGSMNILSIFRHMY